MFTNSGAAEVPSVRNVPPHRPGVAPSEPGRRGLRRRRCCHPRSADTVRVTFRTALAPGREGRHCEAARRTHGRRLLPHLTPRAHSGPGPAAAAAAAAAAGLRPRGRAASARAARARRPAEARDAAKARARPRPRAELPPLRRTGHALGGPRMPRTPRLPAPETAQDNGAGLSGTARGRGGRSREASARGGPPAALWAGGVGPTSGKPSPPPCPHSPDTAPWRGFPRLPPCSPAPGPEPARSRPAVGRGLARVLAGVLARLPAHPEE
ncbi:translation initiation factor IF-2-like [Lutra lutra]|uniref:translation initiation factor IF-2-like n=1 Tax=Lutra lutra TaxID=9657 RepID=UPI001FCFE7F8|nr:translation initiation factor IF-2-like [Lutra lutra]